MDIPSLPVVDGLTGLGPRGGVDMRAPLLRVLTDLYVQKLAHSADEQQHYTELALRLLAAVDVPTRAAVAARLARHLSPPLAVIRRLAADVPEVAAPLRAHPLLQLRERAAGPAPEAAAAAAHAESSASGHGGRRAAVMPVVISPETAAELNDQFFAAGAIERRLILRNLNIAVPVPAGRVAVSRNGAIRQHLEAAALSRNRDDFAKHLAGALLIPRAQARRIADDTLGEAIVVAAKALSVPRDAVFRILMFVNTAIGHSVERIYALAVLYDEITAASAEHMVLIWQSLKRDTSNQYQPLLSPDNVHTEVRSARPAARRTPAPARGGERRDAS